MENMRLAIYSATMDDGGKASILIEETEGGAGKAPYVVTIEVDGGEASRRAYATAEKADRAVQEWTVAAHDCTELTCETPVEVLETVSRISETGVVHTWTLRRCTHVSPSRLAYVSYEACHDWGEMADGSICQGSYGYNVFKRHTLAEARAAFREMALGRIGARVVPDGRGGWVEADEEGAKGGR